MAFEYDEEDIEELAEQWGVTPAEAESLLEVLEEQEETDIFNVPTDRFDRPDDDYMLELADYLDIDVSDLYDMYYGYPPGSHGRV